MSAAHGAGGGRRGASSSRPTHPGACASRSAPKASAKAASFLHCRCGSQSLRALHPSENPSFRRSSLVHLVDALFDFVPTVSCWLLTFRRFATLFSQH
jgi:hypothetical protein